MERKKEVDLSSGLLTEEHFAAYAFAMGEDDLPVRPEEFSCLLGFSGVEVLCLNQPANGGYVHKARWQDIIYRANSPQRLDF